MYVIYILQRKRRGAEEALVGSVLEMETMALDLVYRSKRDAGNSLLYPMKHTLITK